MKRQAVRKLLLILSMLLFPVTLFYFSPALILSAGINGVINGSFVVFALLLVCSVFLGRAFCGYLCPGGGIQECAFAANASTAKQGWRNRIKYVIWVIWIAAVVFCYFSGPGTLRIDFFFETDHGISVHNLTAWIIYYGIVLLILVPALVCGKRAFCHYFCWMAPFMTIGEKLRRLLRLPGLHVSVEPDKCVSCGKCSRVCPMSLESAEITKPGGCDSTECIQCGACVDACPKAALRYRMKENNQHGS